ncbi:MAG: 2-dehydropantoate 2-reductase [Cytophagales bacterium]|nr:2-dehydropantoate 2-reductase [Cytophagales bacterium]
MAAKPIKIGIVGLGPVGSILADRFQNAGCDVSLCIRDVVQANKIKDEGIVLTNVIESESKFKNIYSSISDMAEQELDFLIFAMKAYHIQGAMEEAAELNSDKLTVVSAQNGIDVEQLLVPTFGESKILRMIINYAGGMVEPNTVKATFFTPPNYLGSIDDSKAKEAEQFAEILNGADLATKAVDSFEILKRSWEKTILNAALSALCGVGRLTMAEAMNDPDTLELVEQMISEAVSVAETEKIRFPDGFIRQCMRYLKKGGDHFPSLALDLIEGRQTEVDYFNGKIVEYGRKHYVRTSLNLSFYNMVKAMSNKNIASRIPGEPKDMTKRILDKGMVNASPSSFKNSDCYLGVDLGSAFAKLSVVDEEGDALFRYILPTYSKDRQELENVMQTIASNFNIKFSCATGYGRKHFGQTDIIKTEINCAAAGVAHSFSGEKNIIDIGGEDIKVIRCDGADHVSNFYMNDKCASGTGSFLSEIAERAQINIADMSSLAAHSSYDKELNSFCTVFAKTEIMSWIFDGMTNQDIARGVYISISNRVAKMRLESGIPTYMIGGVIAHHPYLQVLLGDKFDEDIQVIDDPQYVVSLGAALIARQHTKKNDLDSDLKSKESVVS